MINYGLIGVGGFGAEHLRILSDFEEKGRLRLVAACDPAIGRLAELRTKLVERRVAVYEDHEEMLGREEHLSAVTIAAPIPYHFSITRACLARDLFIYLEKPPVPLLDQLDALLAADTRRRVAVGFHMIESDWSRQIKHWLLQGRLGRLREIRAMACWPRADAYYSRARWAGRLQLDGEPVFDGPATNALAHLVHNLLHFATDEPHGAAMPAEIAAGLYRAREIESYDTAFVEGRFAAGPRFSLALTHAGEKTIPFSLHLIGDRGWARVSEDGGRIESPFDSQIFPDPHGQAMVRSYENFLAFILGKQARPSTSLADTRPYVATTNAMLLSSGGIHPISSPWSERRNDLFHIADLPELMSRHLAEPGTPDAPWAATPRRFDLRSTDLAAARELIVSPKIELPIFDA